jgi:Zn-dependent alcohol dehydrogenase
MKTTAAVIHEAGKALEIEELDLEGPRRARSSCASRTPGSATPTCT